MPAPRTTSDLERSVADRERRIIQNERGPGRGQTRVFSVSRAAERLGEFVRGTAGRRRGRRRTIL